MESRKEAYKHLRSHRTVAQRQKELQRKATELRHERRSQNMHAKRMISTEEIAPVNEDAMADISSQQLVKNEYQSLIGSREQRLHALQTLRDVFRKEPGAASAFLSHEDACTALVAALKDQTCAQAACECITNLAASPAAHNSGLVTAAPALCDLLSSSDPNLARQACWALGNIAADGPEARDAVCEVPTCSDSLLQLLEHPDSGVAAQAWFAVSHLLRGQDAPVPSFLDNGLAALARNSVLFADPEVVGQATWAVTYISAKSKAAVEEIFTTEVIAKLLNTAEEVLTQQSIDDAESVVIPIMRALGNAAAQGVFPFAEERLFDLLEKLLQLPSKLIVLETAWFIGNLTGANPQFAAGIFQHDLLIHLRNLLEETTDLQREVSFAVLNMAASDPKCLDALIENTFHKGMYALLKTPDLDCTTNCLGFVDVLMTEFGPAGRGYVPDHVVDVIESLQYSDAANIKSLATSIVARHFNYDEEEGVEDAPAQPQAPAPTETRQYPESRLNASFHV